MSKRNKTYIKPKQPLCSIIVPTMDREEYLPICINSFLSQYYTNWEAIIVNDAGKDVSNIVNSFHDKRLKYISNPVNVGLGATRNEGLKIAQGEYVCFVDQDDGIFPHFLQMMLKEIQSCDNPFLYCDVVRKIQKRNPDKTYSVIGMDIPLSLDYEHDMILYQNITPVTGIFLKRELLNKIGYFDTTLKRYEDHDLNIRASLHHPLKHIPIPGSFFTWRNDSEGTSMSSTPDNLFTTQLPIIYERYWKYAKDQVRVCSIMNQILVARGLKPMFNIGV